MRVSLTMLLVAVLTACGSQPQRSAVVELRVTGQARPHMIGQRRVPDAGNLVAAAAAAGSVWLVAHPPPAGLNAAPATGQLLRIDAATATVQARWQIGGSPTAVAANDGSVWVADGPGLGPGLAAGANQVLQFSLTGQLQHSYPVTNPLSVVALPDAAVVLAEPARGTVFLQRLADGTADAPLRLPEATPTGPDQLAWCPGGPLWAATVDTGARTHLRQFPATAGQRLGPARAETVLAASGTTTMACRPGGLAVLITTLGQAALYLPATGSTKAPPPVQAPPGTVAPSEGNHLWLVADGTLPNGHAQIRLVDIGGLTIGPPTTINTVAHLRIAADTQLWTVDQDPADPSAAVLTNLTAP